jgi:hypothetical protein
VSEDLSGRLLWAVIGSALLVGLVTVSVVPVDAPVDVTGADKVQHLLAYGLLMYWWGMVQPKRRLFWLVFLPLLGATLELVQNLLPARFMEWRDMVANLAGVSLAWFVLRTRAGRLLGHIDAKLFDRGDPGLP